MLILAAAIATGMTLITVPYIGAFEDDGVYLVSAKALAEGSGYRRIDLPGEPLQTKYPPLYPLLLSLIWRVSPGLPQSIRAMQVFGSLCGLGAGLCAYRLMRRVCPLPPWLPMLGAATALVTPFWVLLTQFTMSEPLYALLSIGALAWVCRAADLAPSRASLVAAFMSGCLAALAYLCRSIGLAAAGAVVLTLLVRARWRDAFAAGVAPVVCVAAWGLWLARARAANSAIPQAAALAYDLDYRAWMPHDLAEAARVAWFNLPACAWALLEHTAQLSGDWLDRAVRGGPPAALALAGAATVLLVLLAGVGATFNRRSLAIFIYLASYLAVTLIWPFRPDRFIVPLLPILMTLVLAGVWTLTGRAARMGRAILVAGGAAGQDPGSTAPSRPGAGSVPVRRAVGADAAVVTLASVLTVHALMTDHDRAGDPIVERLQRERETAAQMLRERTPRDAVIATVQRAHFFLTAGRKCVPFMPADDAIGLYFPPDRAFFPGGRAGSPGSASAMTDTIYRRVPAYYRAAGVQFVLMPDRLGGEFRLFERFIERQPERLPLVATSGPYRLWRVHLP